MDNLIKTLTGQLGINETQARGGAAALFKAAQERMGSNEFQQLLGTVPGMQDLLQKVPSGSAGGGMLGGLASMASKLGGGDMAQAAKLVAAFSSLGLNKDMIMKFLPPIMEHLQSHGGQELVARVRAALKL